VFHDLFLIIILLGERLMKREIFLPFGDYFDVGLLYIENEQFLAFNWWLETQAFSLSRPFVKYVVSLVLYTWTFW